MSTCFDGKAVRRPLPAMDAARNTKKSAASHENGALKALLQAAVSS
jgi:hypothetical protein